MPDDHFFGDERPRTPLWLSSQNLPCTKFRLCEVALLGHRPRSARHGSTGREVFHFGVHVSLNSVTDHSFNKISISSLERFSPNLVEPLQASALARSSPPASAWSAASSAVSGSVTVSGAAEIRTAPSPKGSKRNPRAS